MSATIPVIFVTGNDSQDEVHKGKELGAGYLSKPVSAEKLNALTDLLLI